MADGATSPPEPTGEPPAEMAGAIPAELLARAQWLPYRLQGEGPPRPRKVPIDPQQRLPLRGWTDPGRWLGHVAASRVAPARGGVGLVLSASDPYVVVDLDLCRDPVDGAIAPWARRIIGRLASYAEVSVSGTGIHIWVRGRLEPDTAGSWPAADGGKIEIFQGPGRFIAVTGRHQPGSPRQIHDRQPELAALVAELAAASEPAAGAAGQAARRMVPGDAGSQGREASAPQAISAWLAAYCRDHPPVADRSAAFCRLVRACYRAFGAEATRAHVDTINDLTGGHHPTRAAAERDIERILAKFGLDRREDREGAGESGPGGPPDPSVLDDLRRRLRAAEARAERAEAERDAARAKLAEHERGDLWERHELALRAERARRQRLIAVAERGDLSYRDRVITILAMDETDAYPLPQAAGQDRPAPQRLDVGRFKRRLGLAASSNAPAEALAAAARVGLITRTVQAEATDEAGEAWRTTVSIGPGSERPAPPPPDPRRAREEGRPATQGGPAPAPDVIDLAAKRAARGCPDCGGALRASTWVCKGCGVRHEAAALAGVAPDGPDMDSPAHGATDSTGSLHAEINCPTESVGCPDYAPPCVAPAERPGLPSAQPVGLRARRGDEESEAAAAEREWEAGGWEAIFPPVPEPVWRPPRSPGGGSGGAPA